MPVRNTTRFAVLGALTLGRLTGYDVKKILLASTGHFWSESYGQIYPALKALEEEGLVSGTTAQGGRRRRLFALRPAGRCALRRWLRIPPEPQPPRSALLLKVFFGRHAPKGVLRSHVAAFRARQEDKRRHYATIEAELRGCHRDHPDLPYWLLTLDYGNAMAAAGQRWADAALATLDRMDPPVRRSAPRGGDGNTTGKTR